VTATRPRHSNRRMLSRGDRYGAPALQPQHAIERSPLRGYLPSEGRTTNLPFVISQLTVFLSQ